MDKKEYIQSKIRDIKDFPKEGIIFKDITPLLMDVKGVEYVIDLLVENLGGQKVDKVVGMESRGFFFGMLLAQRLLALYRYAKKGNCPTKRFRKPTIWNTDKMYWKFTKMLSLKVKRCLYTMIYSLQEVPLKQW